LGDLDVNGWIILRWVWGCWLDLCSFG